MHTWLVVPVILASVSPLLAFEVICEPKNFTMFVGDNTSLRCFGKCKNYCAVERIIWTKDDHLLQARPPFENLSNPTVNSRFQFMYQNLENGNVSVDIENLQNSDAGTYKCTLTIDGACRQGTINLQVSDASQKADINLKDPNKHYGLIGAAAFIFFIIVIVLAFVLWKKKFGCRHIDKKKKLTYTGDGEESNSSKGSDSTESGLIEKV